MVSPFYLNRPNKFLGIHRPSLCRNFNTKIFSRHFCFFWCQKKKACPARTNRTPRHADTPLKEGNYIPADISTSFILFLKQLINPQDDSSIFMKRPYLIQYVTCIKIPACARMTYPRFETVY